MKYDVEFIQKTYSFYGMTYNTYKVIGVSPKGIMHIQPNIRLDINELRQFINDHPQLEVNIIS